jgi:carboxypeptidase A1
MWLYPWGNSCEILAPDADSLDKACKVAVAATKAVYGTEYQCGPSCKVYQKKTSGSTDDHFYGNVGIKYSFTLELRDKGSKGYYLPETEIIPTGIETVQGLLALWSSLT